MFILNLNYVKPLADVDAHLADHRAYLQKNFERGLFITAGRKTPSTGGIILLRAESRQQAEALVQEDPFYRSRVAEYEIIEFTPSRTGKGFENLLNL